MPIQQKPKYAFTERLALNNGETVDLSYGKVGGNVDDKPYSLEDAVVEYTATIFQQYGINVEDIDTMAKYGAISLAISQDSLLSKTLFGAALDNSEDVRNLLGEVQHIMV